MPAIPRLHRRCPSLRREFAFAIEVAQDAKTSQSNDALGRLVMRIHHDLMKVT
jgi:hypothetical protein